MLLGKKYATSVIVTQVVLAVDGHSSLAIDCKSALTPLMARNASIRVIQPMGIKRIFDGIR
jgi:hypothetical protein